LSIECSCIGQHNYYYSIIITVCVRVNFANIFTKETPLISLFHAYSHCAVACQQLSLWIMRIVINTRRHRFQNYGTTDWWTRQSYPRWCREDRNSSNTYVRRWRALLIRTTGGITARNARSPSLRVTRCTGIIDTNVTHCHVFSAPIVVMWANGLIRFTITSGRSIRDRRSCWTSSTNPQ